MTDRGNRAVRYAQMHHNKRQRNDMRWRRVKEAQASVTPRKEIFAQRVRDIIHLLNGEWIPDILVVLTAGPEQYTGLLNSIREKTDDAGWSGSRHQFLQESVLNRTLRRLEQEELVRRQREAVFPYRTWYRLTPAADQMLMALVPLAEWADEHAGLVKRARRKARHNAP